MKRRTAWKMFGLIGPRGALRTVYKSRVEAKINGHDRDSEAHGWTLVPVVVRRILKSERKGREKR